MLWGRSVQASLTVARKKYVAGQGNPDKATNLLPEDVFGALVRVDPTPQKKFIQISCRWLVDSVLSSVKSDSSSHLTRLGPINYRLHVYQSNQDDLESSIILNRVDPHGSIILYSLNLYNLKRIFNLALELESKHVKLKDPNSFKTDYDYGNYLTALDTELSKTDSAKLKRWNGEIDKAAKQPDNNSRVFPKATVFQLTSYEQAHDICDHLYRVSAFGAFPHWCVAHTESYWNEYHENGSCFYLVASRSKTEYFMCEVQNSIRIVVWDEDGDNFSHDESLRTLNSLGLKPSDLPQFQAEYSKNSYDQEVEIFYVYRKDLNWSGWGVDFKWEWMGPDTQYDVMEKLVDDLDKDPDVHSMRFHADYAFEMGSDTFGRGFDDFIEDLSNNYEASIEVVKEHSFPDEISRYDNYLHGIWYMYLDDLFGENSTGFRISTRWMEAQGIRWDYEKYDLDDLEKHLVNTLRGGGRIKSHFQLQDNPHESVFEILEPELEDFSMTAFKDYKEYTETFKKLLTAAVFKTQDPKKVPKDTIQDILVRSIKIWVDYRERKK